ncbi:MAG: sodium:solute symporter family transporter [Gemmatimonadota bacterium]
MRVAGFVVVAYLVSVSLVGLYLSRRQKTTEQYFLGNRGFPWWAVAFSLIGSIIGSTTFIGHPGEVFRTNMWNMPLHLMLIPVMIFVAKYIVVFYRRTLKMSVYGYLEKRFGYGARVYGGLAFIISRIVDISGTLYFLAVAVGLLTSWDMPTVIIVIGVLTVLYTYLGGITAVVWTDVVQGVVLIGSALACVLYVLLAPEATPGELVSTAWQGGKFSWGNWQFSWVEDNVWVLMLLGIVWALQRYATDQHMVQRYLIARSDREAQRAAYIGGMAALPIWTLFWVFGALLWAHYQLAPGTLPPEVLENQTRVVPYFVQTKLASSVLGLIVAGLVAAAVSSLDSDINSVATVVVEDYYERLRPEATNRQALRVGKTVVLVVGALCIFAALQWIGVQSAIGFMFDLISVASAGVLGLFVLGIFFRRATVRGAWVGIAACVVFTAWATFTSVELPALGRTLLDLGSANYELNPKLIGVFSSLLLLGVGLPASIVLGGGRLESERLTIWSMIRGREPLGAWNEPGRAEEPAKAEVAE